MSTKKFSVLIQPKIQYDIIIARESTVTLLAVTSVPCYPLSNPAVVSVNANDQLQQIATLDPNSEVARIENCVLNLENYILKNEGSEPIRLIYTTESPDCITIYSKFEKMRSNKFQDFTNDFLLQVDRFFESKTPLLEIAHFFDKLPNCNHAAQFTNSVIISLRRLNNTLAHEFIDLINVYDLSFRLGNEITPGFRYFFSLILNNFPELAPIAVSTSVTRCNFLTFLSIIIECNYTQSVGQVLQTFCHINDNYSPETLETVFNFVIKNDIPINQNLLNQLHPILSETSINDVCGHLIASGALQPSKAKEENNLEYEKISKINDELQNKILLLESQLSTAKKEIKSKEVIISNIKSENSSNNDEKVTELISRLNSSENKNKMYEEKLKQLASEFTMRSNPTADRISALQNQIDNQAVTIQYYEKKLKDQEKVTKSDNSETINKLESKVKNLEEKLKTSETKNKELERQLQNSLNKPKEQIDFNKISEVSGLKEKLSEYEKQINELKSNSDSVNRIKELESQNKNYESQLRNKDKTIKEIELKLKTAVESCKELQNENNELLNRLKDQQSSTIVQGDEKAQEMLHKMAVKLRDHMDKLSKSNLIIAQKDLEIKELNSKIDDMKSEIEKLKSSPPKQQQNKQQTTNQKSADQETKFAPYKPNNKQQSPPNEENKFAPYSPAKQQKSPQQSKQDSEKSSPSSEKSNQNNEKVTKEKSDEEEKVKVEVTGPVIYTTSYDPTVEDKGDRVDYGLRKIATIEATEEKVKKDTKGSRQLRKKYNMDKMKLPVIYASNYFSSIRTNEEEEFFYDEEEMMYEEWIPPTSNEQNKEETKQNKEETKQNKEEIKQEIKEETKQEIKETKNDDKKQKSPPNEKQKSPQNEKQKSPQNEKQKSPQNEKQKSPPNEKQKSPQNEKQKSPQNEEVKEGKIEEPKNGKQKKSHKEEEKDAIEAEYEELVALAEANKKKKEEKLLLEEEKRKAREAESLPDEVLEAIYGKVEEKQFYWEPKQKESDSDDLKVIAEELTENKDDEKLTTTTVVPREINNVEEEPLKQEKVVVNETSQKKVSVGFILTLSLISVFVVLMIFLGCFLYKNNSE